MIRKIIDKYERHIMKVSFILAEIANVITIIYAFKVHDQCALIWMQISVLTSFFYQGYLFLNVKYLVLFTLKQTAMWIIPSILYSKDFLSDVGIVILGTITISAFYFSCIYFDYLKDIEMCNAKIETQITNEKIMSIVGAIADSFVVIDKDMKKVFSNSTFDEQINGKILWEFLQQSKYSKRYYNGNPEIFELFSDIREALTGKSGTEIRFGVTRSDNEFFEWNGKLILWEEVSSIVLFGRNVTHILDLEKESSENQYKSALLKTVSHELRTPTNAISAMAQIIKSSGEMSDVNNERLDVISGSCTYQLCLINDLLDYAQIIAGCLKMLKTIFNPVQLMNECLELIKIQQKERLIVLKLELASIPKMLISDPYRIKQVVLNLLSNAKKFTLMGKITLKLSYSNKKLKVQCIDTGIGIPPDKVSLLFTQFGKINNSASINPQGVGLGLMISNMLVKELGGDHIHVESKEGEGSCFSFTIKVEEVTSSRIPEENANVYVPSIYVKTIVNRLEVLIVDDTFFNVLVLSQFLKEEGILVTYVLSGGEALVKVKEREFGCIVMDCEMPMMDGWETIKNMKIMLENREIIRIPPVIAYTAHTSEDVKAKSKEAGMDDILVKPCSKLIALGKIKYWMQVYCLKYQN